MLACLAHPGIDTATKERLKMMHKKRRDGNGLCVTSSEGRHVHALSKHQRCGAIGAEHAWSKAAAGVATTAEHGSVQACKG
jgi:hypothetical protein